MRVGEADLCENTTTGLANQTVSRSKFGTGLEAVIFMRFYL
jgi:hypothetical protein